MKIILMISMDLNIDYESKIQDVLKKLGLNKRISELQAQTKLIDEAQKFVTVTRNADGTVNIDLNADKLQAEKLAGNLSEDRIKAIEEYVNGIKDASDQLNDLYTSLTEDINQYYENLVELQDQWVDYGEQLVKFNEEKNKKELDRLKKLSDAINKALKDLLDEVKRKLTERRQQEDNRKTEEDISKKQQRLAMLRADTSGGHQVEIAQLEKEIAEAQQNYQRTLEDQLLDKLQNQADEAAKQRDHQRLYHGAMRGIDARGRRAARVLRPTVHPRIPPGRVQRHQRDGQRRQAHLPHPRLLWQPRAPPDSSQGISAVTGRPTRKPRPTAGHKPGDQVPAHLRAGTARHRQD